MYFLPLWRLEVQGQDVCRVIFWWDISSWLANGHLLTMSSMCTWRKTSSMFLPCLIMTPVLSDQGPILWLHWAIMMSLKTPCPKSHIGDWGFNRGFWSDMIQSTTGNHLPLLTVQYFSPCLASPGDLSMKGGHDVAELPAPWEAVCLESLPSLPKITLLLEAAFILAKR